MRVCERPRKIEQTDQIPKVLVTVHRAVRTPADVTPMASLVVKSSWVSGLIFGKRSPSLA